MIGIYEVQMVQGHRLMAVKDAIEEAEAYVNELKPILMERDADFPNCADALLFDGRQIAIQPVKEVL